MALTADEEIAELQAVLHRWRTGMLPEEVEYAGQRVRRAKFDAALVQRRLDALLAEKSGVQSAGAIGFIF